MDTHIGTNNFPMLVLLPILIIVAVGIGWWIVKLPTTAWKKVAIGVGGLFMLFGLAVSMVTVYYKASPTFAGTFRFYAYSALTPAGDPFQTPDKDYRQALIVREVVNKDGVIRFLKHPNPDYPSYMMLFAPGKYYYAELQGDTLTIPTGVTAPQPNVTHMSLWWALTKDLSKYVDSVE